MNYFILGDIHGCYFTFREMLDKFWNPEQEMLIILGDFVNKGKHTFAVIEFLLQIEKEQKENLVILKGNNEYLFEQYYRDSITLAVKQKFEHYNLDYIQTLNWMANLPHHREMENIYISHAGIAEDADHPADEFNLDELFNRKALKNIGKTQFIGHIVKEQPFYDETADAWYLDTGAGFGKKLTGAKVNFDGTVKLIHSLNIHEKDKAN